MLRLIIIKLELLGKNISGKELLFIGSLFIGSYLSSSPERNVSRKQEKKQQQKKKKKSNSNNNKRTSNMRQKKNVSIENLLRKALGFGGWNPHGTNRVPP